MTTRQRAEPTIGNGALEVQAVQARAAASGNSEPFGANKEISTGVSEPVDALSTNGHEPSADGHEPPADAPRPLTIARGSEHDFLIAEYTLGLLDRHENARVTSLLSSNAAAAATALKWENLFLSLTDELEPIAPPPHLLQRIQATLGHEITLIKRPRTWPRLVKKSWRYTLGNLWFWRALSVVLAVMAFTYAARPNLAVIDAPPPTHVAILQAPGQTSTPGWIFTLDGKHNLDMTPRVHIDVPANASVQLWTHNPQNRTPRSLGVVSANRAAVIPSATLGTLAPDQIFEMTLEQAGGSPSGSPTGPILFIGRMVELTVKVPSQGASAAPPAATSTTESIPAASPGTVGDQRGR
ncbi:MAG: hypothetical protein EPN41_10375 [Candidimonas sp.]|nr:MAG: hypothetical protein EPN41_10375 [Candidimonas sp.]